MTTTDEDNHMPTHPVINAGTIPVSVPTHKPYNHWRIAFITLATSLALVFCFITWNNHRIQKTEQYLAIYIANEVQLPDDEQIHAITFTGMSWSSNESTLFTGYYKVIVNGQYVLTFTTLSPFSTPRGSDIKAHDTPINWTWFLCTSVDGYYGGESMPGDINTWGTNLKTLDEFYTEGPSRNIYTLKDLKNNNIGVSYDSHTKLR